MKIINRIKKSNLAMRIINAIFFGIGGAIISKALLMLFNVFVSRLLSETQYGIYSIVNNTVQTFTVFAGAGIGITLTRYVALYRVKDKNMAGIIINTLLVFNAILSLIISIFVLIFAEKISNLISNEINIANYIKLTAGTIFFTSVASILQSILQGFEEYKKLAIWQIISNLIILVIGIILTKYFNIIGTVVSLLLLQLLMTVTFAIAILKILKKQDIKLKLAYNQIVKNAITKVAIPAFLSSIFVVPLLWITNFIFTKNNGYEEFAAFSVCLQWFTILNYIPQQLGQVKPIYTQLYDDCEIEKLKQMVKKIMLFSIGIALIVSIILIAGSSIILNLYGEFYKAYKIPFVIMLVTSIFFAIQSQFGSIFQAVGKIWLCFWLNMLWAVSFIVLFIFLQKYGTIGYTVTYLGSYVIYSTISVILFIKIMNKMKKMI